ncbi:hypothetical protein CP532_6335 [Ophiocordyceps camponoti-leonardi (nom. inval.)]|nr:hypothetical protein CP532_6335 [Ophiocordyceps camponoti-leonardi (nom. inval.)]
MDFAASEQPPSKKRRFFKSFSEEDFENITASNAEPSASPRGERVVLANGSENAALEPKSGEKEEEKSMPFDETAFETLVGERLKPETLAALRDGCGNSLERAVNMYFDGTYKKLVQPSSSLPLRKKNHQTTEQKSKSQRPAVVRHDSLRSRYIGAFGIEGWATRSGSNIIKHGDVVRIERQKIQPPRPPKTKAKLGVSPSTPARAAPVASRRVDVIVRFTSESGAEIGRLAKDSANWVSTLMDQRICSFEGTCVYAPERLRTNDTVFLQLRCFLLSTAFDGPCVSLADETPTGLYGLGESADEKELRLRQVALVRLFQEINLQPTVSNATAKDGRKGLLKVAEMDEEKNKDGKKPAAGEASDSSEEGEDLEQDQLDTLYKKAQCFDLATPEAEPADTFALTLRPYQKQSLYWMMAKEKNESGNRELSMHPLWEAYEWPVKDVDDNDLPRVEGQSSFYVNPYSCDLSLDFPLQEQNCLGGILADEMGLGKTIQMLSLIHSHRSEEAIESRLSSGGISSVNQLPRLANSADVLPAPCTTLIVAPMSLLSQWQSEAERASKQGTMKIELYYGNDKTSNLQTLCCSANAGSAPDMVITSYGVVLSEFSGIAAKKGDRTFHNGLFSLRFFRVILDEAHHIKNRASKTARACYAIAAHHRWLLTGTPIVNRLEDLFSLVRFLGAAPWNNFSFWKTFITVPFEAGETARALDVVQTVLEPLVMRRTKDMKTADGQPLVKLPPKEIEIVKVELSAPERDIYDYIFEKAKRTLSRNVETGTVMKAFTTIFAQILRLRQSCCHPVLVRNQEVVADEEEAGAAADAAAGLADDMDLESLIARFTATTEEEEEEEAGRVFGAHALEEIRSEAEKECPLCLEEPMKEQVVTGCWHSACRGCIVDLMKHESDRGAIPRCFSCREPLRQRELFEVVRHDDDVDDDDDDNTNDNGPRISLQRLGVNHSSAKIAELLSQLRRLRRTHPTMKSVVFSQFTSFLSLIEPALDRAKIKFLRLDGTMAQRARAAVLEEFSRRQAFTVLLISLRAGGVGLNLTSAGWVFMMDPWWSFAVEAQAIDRVHRLGQENTVVVKRFVVSGSVEERLLTVQERKKSIATSLGLMSEEEKKAQRIEDIKELLS